jgi:hypothetical protein
MRSARGIGILLGGCAGLLGALWLLQGLGLVHVRPILCLTACEGGRSASPTWSILGAVMLIASLAILAFALRRRR